jgi:hypothetical protein
MGDATPIVADITIEGNRGRRRQVVFHVTGFGKFQGVSSNPTERLMRHLERELKRGKRKSSSSYVIASVDVVEVSADAAKLYTEKLILEMDKKKGEKEKDKGEEKEKAFCFLHFGVTGDIDKCLTLETTGWNGNHFSLLFSS